MKIRTGGSFVTTKDYIWQSDQRTAAVPLLRQNGIWGTVTYTISSTAENVNASTLFGKYWSANVVKRLIIASNTTVGATSISNYALNIPSTMGGTLLVVNNGSIQGAGGESNGGTGGSAIFVGKSTGVSIDNKGTIYGGGGGGGKGGTGGIGKYQDSSTQSGCGGAPGCPAGYTETGGGSGGCCQTYNYCCGLFDCGCVGCSQYTKYRYCEKTIYTDGGVGGAGGVGTGYNQSSTTGSAGSAGGVNAGKGGTGGSGGGFGSSGSNGSVGANGNAGNAPLLGATGGPGYGGLSGYYIVNNSYVSWVTNGTRAGRVG